ncbi:unnamed protein product [Protopolystoma xenopodis]|uniref:Vesicle tethering protein Uso1/P115-like head domain-containing protein n=1 Tax=Protopolystoma xenopodis TaxID=117903 RepID=A0A448WWT0_9PLAT|nr:unnamed protein product [Protopolystoma xenopodis]
MGSPEEDSGSLGAETVEKLVDRLQSSMRLDDRRDALRALKALSRNFRLEVGTLAMPNIVNSLKQDSRDSDIICYSLEALMNVMSDGFTLDTPNDSDLPADLGGQFTEIFIKDIDNVKLIVGFIDAYDLHIRRFSVRFLTILLSNRLRDVQDIILKCPMAISKIVDTLSDSREALRNDGLLLLIEATKGHSNIQKIVAFENVFDRLLNIICSEGLSDGGIVVEDCLKLLRQLLESNPPNQTLFKEGSFIQRLKPFVSLSPEDISSQLGWSAQKVANVQLMLQVIRILVSPNNKSQVTHACQTAMNECKLLASLCDIIMAHGIPSDVLTEAIYAVAEVIRGCSINQSYLAALTVPSEPPQPAVTVLLISMVNDRQSLVVRQAVLYCFQCFLASNPDGQAEIVSTLLPKTAQSHDITAGQLLCRGLFSHDSLSIWFSSISFLHIIRANRRLKEELLRVHLAPTIDSQPVSLLQQTYSLVSQVS